MPIITGRRFAEKDKGKLSGLCNFGAGRLGDKGRKLIAVYEDLLNRG